MGGGTDLYTGEGEGGGGWGCIPFSSFRNVSGMSGMVQKGTMVDSF